MLVDERIAALKRGDFAFVIVDTDDVVAHFGKTDGGNQADISRADNGNFDVFAHSGDVIPHC